MIKNKKVLAITLARGGSKSIKKKNIINVNEQSLICYTIKEVLNSEFIDDYIVSTEDEQIASLVRQYGVGIPFLRPVELAQDTTTSVSALLHAVQKMEKLKNTKYDYIVEIMCTNPLKTVVDIDACIEKLNNTGADSVVSVMQLFDHHPLRIKKIEDDEIKDFCLAEVEESRRQDLKPDAFIRNGSIYALKRDTLMLFKSRRGKTSRPYIMPAEKSVNIDEPVDIFYAEHYLKERETK